MTDRCDELGTRLRYTSRERIFAMQALQTFLWFDGNAEEAVDFWVSVFKGAKKGAVRHYGESFPTPSGAAK
jgi:predicted 3-demethylubiquinone-9 3-methyltransferase (glyoxalase superfamily)